MAETSIKISLELADKAAQKALSDFINRTGEADKGLGKLRDNGSSAFEDIAVHIGKATGLYDIFVGNLVANLATKAFDTLTHAAEALFDTFVVDGVKSAMAAQDAIHSLNVALAQSGHYTAESSKDFEEFASKMEATTAVADDVIIKNAALLESMAGLDEKGLERATKAALNLSAAYDKDLGSATEALGKAAEGNVTALQKMGFEIQKGRDDAETFANALKAIEDKLGNSAAAKAKSFGGAVSDVKNQFDNLLEVIGGYIVNNPVFVAALNQGSQIIRELTASAKDAGPAIMQSLAKALVITADVAGYTLAGFDALFRFLTAGWRELEAQVINASLIIAKALNFVGLASDETVSVLKEMLVDKTKQVFSAFTEQTGLGSATEAVLRIGDSADKAFSQLKSGATTAVEPINQTHHAVTKLDEATKQYQENLKQFALDLVKQSEDNKKQAEERLTLAQAEADTEIALLQDKVNKKQMLETDFLVQKAKIEDEFRKQQIAAQDEQYQNDQNKLQEALDLRKISDEQYIMAKMQLDDNYAAEKAKSDAKYKQEQVKRSKELLDEEKKLNEMKVSAAASTFQNLSSLMSTKSRELFEIGKAASVAAATINTYEAVTKTMASVPYPFNIPLAIAQGIAGAVQVANIVATQPKFADGGIVPGNSFSGDNISARVNSGEMILNRSQQSQLFKLANGGGGSGSLESKIDALINIIAAKDETVVVNIGGRTVVETLRSELNSGRVFT